MLVNAVCAGLAFLVAVNAAPQGVYVGPDGNVGASFGGYHASAGLGGLLSGGPQGGLHAQAGTPLGHFASAGLSGAVGPDGPHGIKYAGAVKPHNGGTQVYQPVQPVYSQQPVQPGFVQQPYPVQKPSTGFNEIFNIPIATLQAVNQYLNNRPPKVAVVAPAYVLGRSNTESKAESGAQSSSSSGSSSSAASSSSASSSSSNSQTEKSGDGVNVPAEAVPGVLVSKNYPNKYNDIFNIPISVLRSVNNLLNG